MKTARRIVIYVALVLVLAAVVLGFLPIEGRNWAYRDCGSFFLQRTPVPSLTGTTGALAEERAHRSCDPPTDDRRTLVVGLGGAGIIGGLLVLGGMLFVGAGSKKSAIRAAGEKQLPR